MTNPNYPAGQAPDRWRTLLVIAIAQLMVVLDGSIVNIAIPSAKADLGMREKRITVLDYVQCHRVQMRLRNQEDR